MSVSVQRPDKAAPSWLTWSALWVVYIVWGSTYLAIRVMVETIPPLLGAGLRFVIAAAVMALALRLRRGRGAVSATPREIGGAAVVGTALLLGGNGLVTVAEQSVPSGLAALLVASVPLWVIVFRKLFGERVAMATLIGVGAGFAGVAILVLPGGGSGDVAVTGLLTVVLASLFWAAGSFFSKRIALPDDPLTATTWEMLAGGAVMSLAGAASGEVPRVDPSSFKTSSVLAFLYLIVAGSLLAFTAYTWLLSHAPISKVATYAYVNPVIAIGLGWVLLDEPLTVAIAIGATLVVASVAFIVRRESRPNAPEVTEPVPEPLPVSASGG